MNLQVNNEHGFDEVTKYLPNTQYYLKSVRYRHVAVRKLVTALSGGDWKAKIFDDIKLFPRLALKAFKDRRISDFQFSTVMFYHSLRTRFTKEEIEICSVFNEDNSVNERVAHMIEGTFKRFALADPKCLTPRIGSGDTFAFYADLMMGPKDQQQIFVINSPTPSPIVEQIQNRFGFNALCQIEGQKRRIVPSLGMLQSYLTALAKTAKLNPVRLTPRIGLSSDEDIRKNGTNQTRDVAVPFGPVKLPKKADAIDCPTDEDFLFHDGSYHGSLVTYIPESHKKAYVEIYDILMEVADSIEAPEQRHKLIEVAKKMIDMEFHVYLLSPTNSIAQKFDSLPEWLDYVFWSNISGKTNQLKEFATSNLVTQIVQKFLQNPTIVRQTTLFESLTERGKRENSIYQQLLKEAQGLYSSTDIRVNLMREFFKGAAL